MRNSRLTVWTLGLAMLAASMIGCSQGAKHDAGDELRAAVGRAKQLHQRAVGLLTSPKFRIGEDMGPVVEEATAATEGDVSLVFEDQLHPQVLPTLQKAESVLSEALAAHKAEAAAPDVALAQAMLGRVQSLEGFCRGSQARKDMLKIAQAKARARSLLGSARLQADVVSFHRTLAGLGEQDIVKRIRSQQQDLEDVQAKLEQTRGRIAELEQEKARQAKRFEQHSAEARALRIEGRQTTGQPGLDLMDQAIAQQQKANQAELRIAEIEDELSSLSVDVDSLELKERTIQAQLEALQTARRRRGAQGQAAGENVAAARSELDELTQELQQLLDEMETLATQAEQDYDAAANYYDLALGNLRDADGAGMETDDSQADVLMSTADVMARALSLHEELATYAVELRETWPKLGVNEQAPTVDQISFIEEPEEISDQAAQYYAQAATLYENAARLVAPQLRWAYQGQIAVAYARFYELTNDATALQDAREALNEAIAGREASPYVASLVELRDLIGP